MDLKLIELAQQLEAKIVTNDFNLNKVAQVRGVAVLNINDLANSLRPVVLPGEKMRVVIMKEGKEYDQGVGYLDDGTMVVVDHARRLIGRTVEIRVTSVLQTASGKMIFGRLDDASRPEAGARYRGGFERLTGPQQSRALRRTLRNCYIEQAAVAVKVMLEYCCSDVDPC